MPPQCAVVNNFGLDRAAAPRRWWCGGTRENDHAADGAAAATRSSRTGDAIAVAITTAREEGLMAIMMLFR
jgi:hypothetical protein